MVKAFGSMRELAQYIHALLRSDRDVNVAVGGFTGEGKTTFSTKLAKEYSIVSGQAFDMSRLTWSRKELMTWIDGDGAEKKGRLPEYSVIVPDEFFLMFYKRNWYNDAQIDAISVFNMCRDRHLFIIGNVPDMWDLDSAFLKRIRFYIYIPSRGIAWLFEQENNPFSNDPWNLAENRKSFRKDHSPFKIPNFICELHYDDWEPEEKKEYLEIRARKRVEALGQDKSQQIEKYSRVKAQRNALIRLIATDLVTKKDHRVVTGLAIAEVADCSEELVSQVINGVMT